MNDRNMSTQRGLWWVALALALVMAVTRLGHFGEYGGPLDASWAVFFLGGLWLRDLRAFPAYFVLAWVVDLAAFALGTPTNCYTIAYVFLIPAYGALWMAGRWVADGGYVKLSAAVVVGALTTFVVANLGMFWLAPSVSAPTLSAYSSAVAGYFPGYLLTLSSYVAVGLLVERLVSLRRRAIA